MRHTTATHDLMGEYGWSYIKVCQERTRIALERPQLVADVSENEVAEVHARPVTVTPSDLVHAHPERDHRYLRVLDDPGGGPAQ
jgi:hypothetical protein